ncbi:hypothetical protein E2C01_035202 [Portunus trituberculatus]|uniref:Uncharacterized protein n=1 Tax=Portunus trituberculatus TaxID=210409 RepID=A0A5B7F531_PORTR|nr:hypothetical protein [Portunus trituberculatus]
MCKFIFFLYGFPLLSILYIVVALPAFIANSVWNCFYVVLTFFLTFPSFLSSSFLSLSACWPSLIFVHFSLLLLLSLSPFTFRYLTCGAIPSCLCLLAPRVSPHPNYCFPTYYAAFHSMQEPHIVHTTKGKQRGAGALAAITLHFQ